MENKPKFRPDTDAKLMDQVREVLRYYHYAYRTESTYCQWILRDSLSKIPSFARWMRCSSVKNAHVHPVHCAFSPPRALPSTKIHEFCKRLTIFSFSEAKLTPRKFDTKHIEKFLSHLATKGNVTASTQRQALNALVFLYRDVLNQPLDGKIAPVRSKRKPSPPTVLTQEEVQQSLRMISGTHALMAKLLYGTGLRLLECIRLRIQDIDFGQDILYVRGGKGGKDRTTILPQNIREELRLHIEKVTDLHHRDLEEGYGEVYLPNALVRKYPNAGRETRWQYVFPAKKRSIDPRSGREMRHHVLESGLQKAVKLAVQRAGIQKRATCHTLRHSFATHMLENGINIGVLQELMGHADVKTTEIYTNMMKRDIASLQSPLDRLKEL